MKHHPPRRDAGNIVLTGFMATGKTTVGRILADRLGMEFVDSDQLIEERHGPIPSIFDRGGEAAFRDLEAATARELAARRGLVIATGGGMLIDHDNAAVLQRSGRIFCLAADVDEIKRRVVAAVRAGGPSRPLLEGADRGARVEDLLDARRDRYDQFEQVPTTDRTPSQVAEDILARLT